MKKEELLRQLREAIKTEESAVELYLKHFSAIVTKSGLPRGDIVAIKEIIRRNVKDTEQHKKKLHSLIQQVQQESIDVY